jgi:GNAT superfamily N-acetyltransferase
MITVREATGTDRAALDTHRSSGEDEQQRYRGRRSPAQTASHVAVAEIDGTVCGSIGWTLVADDTLLQYVYVEEWARGVGVGDALMRAVLEWARAHGAHTVGSSALPGDRALKNLFERHGLVAREILVEKRLD